MRPEALELDLEERGAVQWVVLDGSEVPDLGFNFRLSTAVFLKEGRYVLKVNIPLPLLESTYCRLIPFHSYTLTCVFINYRKLN